MRCKIAHNSFITRAEYDEVCLITDKVNPIFKEAIVNLNNVNITELQKGEITENLLSTSNASFSEFTNKLDQVFINLEELVKYEPKNKEIEISGWEECLDLAFKNHYVDKDFCEKVISLHNFKSRALLFPEILSSEIDILKLIHLIKELEDIIFECRESIAIGYMRMRDDY